MPELINFKKWPFTLKSVPATSVALIRGPVSAFFGPAEDFPYWKYVVLAGVKQRTHQAELVGKTIEKKHVSKSIGKLIVF